MQSTMLQKLSFLCVVLFFSGIALASSNPSVLDNASASKTVQDFLYFSIDVEGFHPTSTATNQYMPILRTLYAAMDFNDQQQSAIQEPRQLLSLALSLLWNNQNGLSQNGNLIALESLSLPALDIPSECWTLSSSPAVQSTILKTQKLFQFFEAMLDSIQEHRKSSKRAFSDTISVVVSGGGPAGLVAAVSALSQGADVTLIEKRTNYTRNVWFDLMAPPFSQAQSFLRLWGILDQETEIVRHSSPPSTESKEQDKNDSSSSASASGFKVVTIRAQILERFLSKILSLHNVKMLFGSEVIHSCNPINTRRVIIHSFASTSTPRPSSEELQSLCSSVDTSSDSYLEADVLVAADGAHSLLRSQSNITYDPLPFYFPTASEAMLPEGVPAEVAGRSYAPHQFSLLVGFNPDPSSPTGCPLVAPQEQISPFDAASAYPGLSAVFKRFYNGHCTMQILADHSLGAEMASWFNTTTSSPSSLGLVTRDEESERKLWNLLLKAADHFLEKSTNSVENLQNLISVSSSTQKFDIMPLDVQIRKTSHSFRLLEPDNKSRKSNGVAVVAVMGDSSMTAHYRLGVGINNLFWQSTELVTLIRNLNALGSSNMARGSTASGYPLRVPVPQKKEDRDKGPMDSKVIPVGSFVDHLNKAAQKRLVKLAELQSATIFYETRCGHVMLFSPPDDEEQQNDDKKNKEMSMSLADTSMIWKRDPTNAGSLIEPETEADVWAGCNFTP